MGKVFAGSTRCASIVEAYVAAGEPVTDDDFQEMITHWALVDKVVPDRAEPTAASETTVDVVKDYNA